MVIEENTMIQNFQELATKEYLKELEEFVNYLGVDYDDYIEYLNPDIDFDDISR